MIKVDLWSWSLAIDDEALQKAERLLSEDELQRANSFVRAKHRRRFIAGRARLRKILGQATDQAPHSIRFEYGTNGKPSAPEAPQFNLSHSGNFAMLALCQSSSVGLDIEQVSSVEPGVAKRFFSPAEISQLNRVPPEFWTPAFYRIWTRKEAILKALGVGLSASLYSFDVSLFPDEQARVVRLEGDDASAWRLRHLDPGPDVVGALAVRTCGQEMQLVWHEKFGDVH